MSRPGKKKKLLFILEIVVLLLFIGGLYVYGQISAKLDKIEQPVFEEDRVLVNPEAPKITGYKTYAVFGIDTRGEGTAYSASNSDTIIIVSVNNDTKQVKMVSVYRDTLLNIGNDTYSKSNAAYAYGGPEQAISMLNTNLDLNITDYATADFSALTEVIDLLGGLDIPLTYEEMEHMNNYCVETSKVTGKEYTPLEKPDPAPEDITKILGTYHLNGVQATSYCRIRYTAEMDMGRTERQRLVIGMIVDKAKKAGLTTIFSIMDKVFPMVQTSISKTEILHLIPTMLGYNIGDTTGFPMEYKFSNVRGSIIVPTTLESNVVELHKFLYGSAENYTPSAEVVTRSNKILEIVGGTGKLEDAAAAPPAENTTDTADTAADDSFVWTETTTYTETYDNSYDNGSGYDGSYDNSTGGGYDESTDGSYDGGYDESTDGSYDGGYDESTDGSYDGSYDEGTDGSYDGGYDEGTDGGYDGGYDEGTDVGYDESTGVEG